MPQVIVHTGIGEGQGHTAGERDDHHRRKADQRNEDKQHQKNRHGGHKIVLIQDAELGHIKPIVPEIRGVALVIIDDGQAVGFQVFRVVVVVASLFGYLQPPAHRVPGVEHLYLRAGAADDLMKQGICKGIAGLHVRHIEADIGLFPVIRKPPGDGGVIAIIQHIAPQQHGEPQRLSRDDVQAFPGDHVGDDGHIAARQIVSAALVIQHIGTGAGRQVNRLAGEGIPGRLGEEGSAGCNFPVFGSIGDAQDAVVPLDGHRAVTAQRRRLHLRPGSDLDAVFLRQSFHLLPTDLFLIAAHVVFKIHRPAGKAVGRAAAQHGGIKGGKIGPGNQKRHHQHIPHRLPALEFHHGCGDDVLVSLSPSPAVHHRVKENHIDAHKGRLIKNRAHRRRRIPAKDIHKEARHQVAGQRACHHQKNPHPAIPGFDLPDGFRAVGLLNHVHDVGAPDGTVPHPKQDRHHIPGKEQGQQIGLRVKGQGHFLGIHQKQPEYLPHAPGQRTAQKGPCRTGEQREYRQLFPHLGLELTPGGAQRQEHARLLGFLPEEQPGGIGRKDGTPHHRQNKHHHHLFAGVAALRQHRQDGGRTHHTAVGRNQQDRKEAASSQKSIPALVFAAQHTVNFRKMPHRITPCPFPGWCPAVCPETRPGRPALWPASSRPPRP